LEINETKIKETFGKNVSYYRKKAGLTQKDLAEKLNYTDKLVSKWERGEGLPDLVIACALAEIFGVSVNDLLNEKTIKTPTTQHNKIITAILSCGVAWLVAVVLFFFFTVLNQTVFHSWLLFIYAIPISAIILVVFSNLWWGKLLQFLSTALLIWTVPLSIVLTLVFVGGIYQLFIIAGVVQILEIFWFLLKKQKK